MNENSRNEEFDFEDEFEDDAGVQKKEGTEIDFIRLKVILEEVIEGILLKYNVISGEIEPKYVSINQMAEEFGVSRQTINNWVKHRTMREFFNSKKKNTGNRFVFDIDGIRKAIIKDGAYMGIRYSVIRKIRNSMKMVTDTKSKKDVNGM